MGLEWKKRSDSLEKGQERGTPGKLEQVTFADGSWGDRR